MNFKAVPLSLGPLQPLECIMCSDYLQVMEEKMTAKIMKEARAQHQDLEAENDVQIRGDRNRDRQVRNSLETYLMAAEWPVWT